MSNMVVNTNVLALNSHRAMKQVGNTQSRASARLSSGLKINSAADDAAGLAISEKMRAQIRGLDMASKNAQDGISLIQTAEGGMQEIDNMIQRIRELTVQVSNDTNENNALGTGDRQKIQDEIDQLTAEIDSMANRVEFNKKKVINGSFADTKSVLSSANMELLNATTAQGEAQAKYDAIVAAIGIAGDGTGLADALDTAKSAFESEQATFNTASKAYAQAGVVYETAKAAYEAAKETLLNHVASATGSTLSTSGVVNDVSDWNDGGANSDALAAYLDAVKAWGADDLGITLATGANAPTNIITTYDPTTDLYSVDPTAGAIGQYKTSDKSDYDDALSAYNIKLNAYKSAQAQYDAGIKQKDEASAELKTANLIKSTATSKNNAALEADTLGTASKLYFQVGANSNQGLDMSIASVKTDMLGIGDGKGKSIIDVVKDSGRDITGYLDVLDTALSYVTTERSKLGAAQNRLEYTIKSLDISSENLSASESRIRDTDMAKEMMNLTKANVLQQAAISMLAQANQAPQSVLQLLQ